MTYQPQENPLWDKPTSPSTMDFVEAKQQSTLTPLTHLGCLRVSGIDAAKFLQGQLSCDVNAVSRKQPSLGILANLKGRAIATFRLHLLDDVFYLEMPYECLTLTLETLKKYAVFSKVEIAIDDTYRLYGTMHIEPTALTADYATCIDQAQLRYLLFSQQPITTPYPVMPSTFWRYCDIEAGLPSVFKTTQECFLPHRINYHELGGLSFNKGCYVGQEVIARMHYRATLKHHLYHLVLTSDAAINPGDDIHSLENNTIGTIVDAINIGAQTVALAELQDSAATVNTVNINNINMDVTICMPTLPS